MTDSNILVIKLSALGDVVLATGWFKMLRQRHPKAHLALMTKGAFADFCRSMGVFDEIIVDNRPKFDFAGWKRICKSILADRTWDVIYDLQSKNFHSRALGRYYPIARFLTRHAMNWAHLVPDGFEILSTPAKRAFSFKTPTVKFLALTPEPPDLSFCHGEHKHFDLLPEKYALLIPGCSPQHPYKRWSPANYRALADRFAAHGIKSVVMGTPAERAEIAAICRDNPNAVDFMGKSSLADIPDLARGAVAVVGNDTGPSHMARIAGARTVSLFSSITRTSAREAPNAVNLIKDDINAITVDEVLSALRTMHFLHPLVTHDISHFSP